MELLPFPDGSYPPSLYFYARSIEDLLSSRDEVVNRTLNAHLRSSFLVETDNLITGLGLATCNLTAKLFGDPWLFSRVATDKDGNVTRYQLADNYIYLPFVRHNPDLNKQNILTLTDTFGLLETTFSSLVQKEAKKELIETHWASSVFLLAVYRSDLKDSYFLLGSSHLPRRKKSLVDIFNIFPNLNPKITS